MGECDSFGYIPFILWCQDWTGESTQNGQQINPIVDCVKYFPFSISREATLRRMYGDNKPNEADAQQYNGEVYGGINTGSNPVLTTQKTNKMEFRYPVRDEF